VVPFGFTGFLASLPIQLKNLGPGLGLLPNWGQKLRKVRVLPTKKRKGGFWVLFNWVKILLNYSWTYF